MFLGDNTGQDELLADAESIFIMKFVETRFTNVFPILELGKNTIFLILQFFLMIPKE